MSDPAGRGVLYIVWGDKVQATLDRSIQSLKKHHPTLPVHIERVKPADLTRGLSEKSHMGAITPFKSTLYLDADTVVMGKLDSAFEQAERFGIACAICECPWMRRYGQSMGDQTEYNTGVIFFTQSARNVFDAWEKLAPTIPATSRWTTMDNVPRGLPFDDQASFAEAIRQSNFNPFVLPMNYNLRPFYNRGGFAPVKVWHDYIDPPPGLEELSAACETGQRPVTFFELVDPKKQSSP